MKVTRFFCQSAGALLMAAALALFLANWEAGELVIARDPILNISTKLLFEIVGSLALIVALFCLFGQRRMTQAGIVAWLTTLILAYTICLLTSDLRNANALLGNLPTTFGVTPTFALILGGSLSAYLLLGSYLVLFLLGPKIEKELRLSANGTGYKMPCPECGRHIRFDPQNLGQRTQCPECKSGITLRNPQNLKISCFFCKEHIEFPVHALGRKIPCPHCKKDITLIEPK